MVPYNRTKLSCYTGYFVQAVINNLPPLLFIIFNKQFGIDLKKLSLIITINFVSQMSVDLF
ncbi:MAG: MFS transporter, partial [Oscillospiraceae bacterium]|nr:MFS transporter [Oscillospiraceae bacterium]